MSRLGGFGVRAAVTATVLALAVSGCTSGDSSTGSTPGTTDTSTGPGTTLTKPNAPFQVKLALLAGGVRGKQRQVVKRALTKPIDAWIEGAFVAPSYPTTDFRAGLASWTPKAAALAKRDRNFTTNAALGDKVVAVVADHRSARLYVFAYNGKTGGATARVQLRLTEQRDDGSLVKVGIGGQLYLTRDGNTWDIFGYDLSRTEAPA